LRPEIPEERPVTLRRYRANATAFWGSLLLALLCGCGRNGPEKSAKELILLCGSSFVPPAQELCAKFKAETGISVVQTVGGSEDLLPLVKVGQKGDIFVTHDPYLDYVKEAKAYSEHVEVGFVAPVLAVQKGNPKGLKKLEDLAKPGLKVALTDPKYSTCGEMVFGLLEKKGIKDEVMKNVENRLTKGHGNLGTFLKTGAVDAAILWNGVAYTFRDSLDVVKAPYEYDTEVRVHVMAMSYSKHPDLLKSFMAYASKEGAKVFAGHGYVK
jgi:molybdate transport system substrate-binding protein